MSANLIPAVIGYLLFALFVGFLTLKIGALPLTLIIGAVHADVPLRLRPVDPRGVDLV